MDSNFVKILFSEIFELNLMKTLVFSTKTIMLLKLFYTNGSQILRFLRKWFLVVVLGTCFNDVYQTCFNDVSRRVVNDVSGSCCNDVSETCCKDVAGTCCNDVSEL